MEHDGRLNLGKVQLDPETSTSGRWVETPWGGKVKIARVNNPKHREKLAILTRPHLHKLRGKGADQELAQELHTKAMIGTVFLDIEGWESAEGEPLEFSEQLAETILLSPEFDHIGSWIRAEAGADQEFTLAAREQAAGN